VGTRRLEKETEEYNIFLKSLPIIIINAKLLPMIKIVELDSRPFEISVSQFLRRHLSEGEFLIITRDLGVSHSGFKSLVNMIASDMNLSSSTHHSVMGYVAILKEKVSNGEARKLTERSGFYEEITELMARKEGE